MCVAAQSTSPAWHHSMPSGMGAGKGHAKAGRLVANDIWLCHRAPGWRAYIVQHEAVELGHAQLVLVSRRRGHGGLRVLADAQACHRKRSCFPRHRAHHLEPRLQGNEVSCERARSCRYRSSALRPSAVLT